MKLNNAIKTPVQSLGRQKTTGQENNQALTQTIGKVGVNLAAQGIDLINKKQQQDGRVAAEEKESQFWRQYGGKEFFSVDELPENVLTESMRLKGRVNSAEVLPALYENFSKEMIGETAKMISLPGSRDRWLASMEITASKKLTQVQTAANATLENQIQKDQLTSFNNAKSSEKWDLSLDLIDGMFGATDAEKKLFRDDVYRKKESAGYQGLIASGDVKSMQAASTVLSQNNEDYQAAGGNLDSTAQLAAKHAIDRELFRVSKAEKSVSLYEKEALNHRITLTKKNGYESGSLNLDALNTLINDTKLMNLKTNGQYTEELLQLDEVGVFVGSVDMQNKMPRVARDAFAKSVKGRGFSDEQNAQLRNDLAEANAAQTLLERTDYMLSVEKSGALGPNGLVPLSLQLGAEQFSANLAQRFNQYKISQMNYGRDMGDGMLKKEEALRFGRQFRTMSTKEQTGYAQMVSESLGNNAITFFKQISKSGEARTFAMAGIATNAGFLENSSALLNGRKFIENNPKEVKEIKSSIFDRSLQSINQAYINQPEKRKAVKEAVFSAYIGLVKQDGNFNSVDDDAYDRAVEIATGGLFEFGGRTIPVPEYGMIPEVMTEYLTGERGISPAYIDKIGVPFGTTSKQFIRDLNDGEYSLEPAAMSGEYYVVKKVDDRFEAIQNEEGGLYILPYDKDADRWPNRRNPYRGFFQ